ncbi:hypothetical protein ACIBUY_15480 [Streptomyces sp. NPDC050085]|uniref:hypothetical protein n=1 Tax=Streptomyces sp. NPDC050085 TaxID=3365600 RepID=UPI0037A8689E
MTGVTSACSGSSAESKAPQQRKTASSSASSAAQPASRSGREELDEEARRLLGIPDRWEADEKGLVSSGSLALPGENLDETVEPGTALRVEVACAGEGTVTFTVVSGTAKTAQRVDCTQPMTNGFDFTTAGSSLAIQADSPDEQEVGTAYVVSRTT